MTLMGWCPVALLLIALLVTGCAVSAVALRNTLDFNKAMPRGEGGCHFRSRQAVGGGSRSAHRMGIAAGWETVAGAIAKKLVEHAGFCYFQTIRENERRKGGIKE
ncbi:MAG TPA: hypothetical protein VFR82_03655 [Nitrospira sp.]|nr:hypothetical protein [Nitrospira sp.]